ncbi:hypothetical protein CDV31_005612 [Fusarium ambrosium]|uniref:Uncharacterized protein n=1 Tax=Fusarium ambrosium TaxID=131363 RepID=A0A428UHX7_9HYPO|nr:hypothetical protein CDV31_005612 [Fusarium ambrosium]
MHFSKRATFVFTHQLTTISHIPRGFAASAGTRDDRIFQDFVLQFFFFLTFCLGLVTPPAFPDLHERVVHARRG